MYLQGPEGYLKPSVGKDCFILQKYYDYQIVTAGRLYDVIATQKLLVLLGLASSLVEYLLRNIISSGDPSLSPTKGAQEFFERKFTSHKVQRQFLEICHWN